MCTNGYSIMFRYSKKAKRITFFIRPTYVWYNRNTLFLHIKANCPIKVSVCFLKASRPASYQAKIRCNYSIIHLNFGNKSFGIGKYLINISIV